MTFLLAAALAAPDLWVTSWYGERFRGRPTASGEIFDPYEKTNRQIHKVNLAVDKVFFGPASKGYSSVVPAPTLDSVGHFADNLGMPAVAVNSLLQGDLEQTGTAVLRFVINSTVGFAGLADPATAFDIAQADTDFGETLHVWGFGEGAYVELPFYGPSTARDSIGVLADFFTNPLTFAPQRPVDNIGVIASVLQRMGDRGRYSGTVDSILYDSADSYAQARIIYLQNRRFELGGGGGVDADPYSDSSSDPYADIYDDPYLDPYSE